MNRPLAIAGLLLAALCSGCPQTGVICSTSEVRCGNTCAALKSDPQHCGACGNACAIGFVCSAGACSCDPKLNVTACGQACVDLSSSPANCGACGVACTAGQLCDTVSGATACATHCASGHTACGQSCVDLQSDRAHCGTCDVACPQGTACLAGACQATLVAACFNSGELFSLDAQAEIVSATAAQAPPAQPIGEAFHGQHELLVADTQSNLLYGFTAGATLVPEATPDPIGHGAQSLAVQGQLAFVVNSSDHTLDVLDLSRPAGSRRLCPGGGSACTASVLLPDSTFPQYVALTSDGGAAFVSLSGDVTHAGDDPVGNRIAWISMPDLTLQGMTALRSESPDAGVQPRPQGLAVVGGKLFVALANLQGYVPGSQGEVAVLDLPDADGGLRLEQNIKLGPACVNAGAVLPVGGTLFVACGPQYDPSFTTVAIPGALAGVDMANLVPAFAPHPFDCGGAAGCHPGGASRLALAGGKLFIGDSIDGRLFTADPVTGALLRGAANPLLVCPAPDGGFNFISDVAAPVLP